MMFLPAALAMLSSGDPQIAKGRKPAVQRKAPDVVRSVADSINGFAFALLDRTGIPNNKNVLISPYSVDTALSMLAPGTSGKDQHNLLSKIGGGLTVSQLEAGNKQLSSSMLHAEGQPLQVANSAWIFKGFPTNRPYITSLQQNFHAELHPFSPNQASVDKMNAWVGEKTKHRIDKIISSLNPAVRLVLINAIAFDGKWQTQFDPKQTRDQAFHKADGESPNVPMMHMRQEIPYMRNDELRAVKLDYQGKAFSMLLMLPEKGKDAGALLRSMTASKVSSVIAKMSSEELPLALPRFKFSDEYQLKGPLSAMGLESLFTDTDFSRISPKLARGAVDQVIHKTFIDVDEKGTKAAAATGITVRVLAIRQNAPEFIADRPFAFFIIHNPTKTILFVGVVNNPKA